jgi:hypothetical protein
MITCQRFCNKNHEPGHKIRGGGALLKHDTLMMEVLRYKVHFGNIPHVPAPAPPPGCKTARGADEEAKTREEHRKIKKMK